MVCEAGLPALATSLAVTYGRSTPGPADPLDRARLALAITAGETALRPRAVSLSTVVHVLADGFSSWLLAAAALLVVFAVRRVRLTSPRAAPAGLVATAAPAAAVPPTCTGVTRNYDVAVINLDIPYNRWGPNATTGAKRLDADEMMYVLQQDKPLGRLAIRRRHPGRDQTARAAVHPGQHR